MWGTESKTKPRIQNWKRKLRPVGRWLWSASYSFPWSCCSWWASLKFELCLNFIYNFHFLNFFSNTIFLKEKRLRVEWVKTFECLWMFLKGMLHKIIMFLRSAPLAFCLEYFLHHTSYNIREGNVFPIWLWMTPTWWYPWENRRSTLTSQSEEFASWSTGSFDLTGITFLK